MMTRDPELKIAHLIDAPDARPVLERWFVETWEPWYGPDGPGDAAADLAACASRDALPICLVALSEDGAPCGTAALKAESVGSDIADGPWLAAVLVPEHQQGKGIGTRLVAAIEAEATRLGFEAIYSSTDTAMGILERRGWREIGASQSLRGRVRVYRWPG